MPPFIIPITTKYGIIFLIFLASIFGAATRTYFEYMEKKCDLKVFLKKFIRNCFFSIGFGFLSAYVFLRFYPSENVIAIGAAYVGSALGLNVMLAFHQLPLKEMIQARLSR